MLDKLKMLVMPVVNVVMGLWNKIPADKQTHVLIGWGISLLVGLVCLCWHLPLMWCFVINALVAVGKEVWNHFHAATCDVKNAVAKIGGFIPAWLVLWLVKLFM